MKTNSIGFTTILFIVFLVLKLTNTITWSWWWITCPLWGPFALLIGFILIICIIGIICGADVAESIKKGFNDSLNEYLTSKK